MRTAILAALLILLPVTAMADVSSGDYHGLLVAQDAVTGAITGGYNDAHGSGYGCAFLFRGVMGDNGIFTVEVTPSDTNPSKPIKGVMVAGEKQVVLRLDTDPDGCWGGARDFSGRSDLSLSRKLTTAYPWQRVAMVNKKRSYLYATDSAPQPSKAYLVDLDVVGVAGTGNGRVLVNYVGGKKAVSGWLAAEDLGP